MSQRFKVFKRVTQGWSIVVGSWLDLYSDFVINNRSLGNFGSITNVYVSAGKGFYGVGFGFPLLLDLPEDDLKCDSADFLRTLDKYQLTDGLGRLFASSLSISAIKSIVSEFNIWVKTKLACILDFEAEIKEAAEIGFALDDLNVAMNLRIDLEASDRAKMEKFSKDDVFSPRSGESLAGNSKKLAGNSKKLAGNSKKLAGNSKKLAGNSKNLAPKLRNVKKHFRSKFNFESKKSENLKVENSFSDESFNFI
jgi:hypothetical protein